MDIDQRRPPTMLTTWALLRIAGIEPEWIRYDWTRHGWHIIIPARGVSRLQRIALQAILGSDPKREAFNLRRWRGGIYLNQLFEPSPFQAERGR